MASGFLPVRPSHAQVTVLRPAMPTEQQRAIRLRVLFRLRADIGADIARLAQSFAQVEDDIRLLMGGVHSDPPAA